MHYVDFLATPATRCGCKSGILDRWQEWPQKPPSRLLAPAAQMAHGMKKTFIMESHNFIPPTTEGQARYYWFQPRNIRPQDETLSKMMNEDAQHACEEDRAVLNAIQLGMSNKSSPHINLPIDGGRLHFCRQLQVMINEERQVDKQTAV